ncbi:hypothetical protein CMK22_05035 [Candidatus Poribacteria bacterium]|nr:hypothetical protein [Candidatus Poribacteria bacterium]
MFLKELADIGFLTIRLQPEWEMASNMRWLIVQSRICADHSETNHRALMMDLFLFRIRKHLLDDLKHHTTS